MGGVFPREAANLGREHAIGVCRHFPAGEAGIGIRAACYKPPRRVKEQLCVLVRGQNGQGGYHHLVGEFKDKLVLGNILAVLSGEHHCVDAGWPAQLIVFHRDLGFPVRP